MVGDKRVFDRELKQVCLKIDRLLAAERLPATVRPSYLVEAIRAYPGRGGKRLRPALLMWCCGLLGGDPAKAYHAALAVELYHNWTLVHDDIIDQDETRRGEPACHTLLRGAFPSEAHPGTSNEIRDKFGCDMAILAGDIQHGWAIDSLARATEDGVRPEIVLALIRRMSGWLTPALISGEALDVEFPYLSEVSAPEIESMLALKTGALLQFAAETGAMIALDSADTERVELREVGTFARCGGIAFQLIDDWLNIFGEEKKIGKPVGSDLREGKKTMLLSLTLELADPACAAELRKLVGNPDITEADIINAREIMRESGAEEKILEVANKFAIDAAAILYRLPDNRYRDLLAIWLDQLVNRIK